jgi:hypothetical protein
MLIGDTSRQHYSRERTQAGPKSYGGNNTGKQQQNMTLESSTNDFREKEENQASHTGVELNNCVLRENGPSAKTARPLSKGNRTGSGQKPETMLEIVTLNIEGIKCNSPYLNHLCDENRILCLQEHWLHGYEINTIQGILSGFDFNISCFDDEQIDIELQKRRGKGGVITIWPQKFSHKITKLEKEERFVVIEVLADKHKMILINNYLPTMMTGSEPNYIEHLDKLSVLIEKYEDTHNIVIAGDLNSSLLPARNNNHDKLLKQFCRKHQLRHTINNTHCPTFHHHNGKSNSQIDYILENIQGNILLDTKIEDQHQLNGSAHVPVRTTTTLVISLNKCQDKKQKHKTILKWEETNIPSYQDAIEKAVLENLSNSSDVYIQAEDIINLIVTASKTNVTNKTVTLKGPSWKASPPVKELISENKRAFL